MSATYYYARHNVELGEATRECDCSKPCQKVVKAEDYDALVLKLAAVRDYCEYREQHSAIARDVIKLLDSTVLPTGEERQ